MKKKDRRKKLLALAAAGVLILNTGASFAAEGGAGRTVFQSILDYCNGFTYTNTISQNSAYGREESYSMTSVPGTAVKPLVLACDTIYGTLNINKIINYASGLGYRVAGALNSDFFDTSTGIPLGVAIEKGILKTSPEGYNALCFDDQGRASVVQAAGITFKLTNLGGGEANIPANQVTEDDGVLDIEQCEGETGEEGSSEQGQAAAAPAGPREPVTNKGKTTTLYHLNKLRNQYGGMVLIDDAFSTVSTRTSTPGWFVRFKVLEGNMKARGSMKLQVVQCYETSQAQAIDDGYMYLTADSRCGLEYEYEKYAPGDIVELTTSCSSDVLASAAWATGAGDILVKDGLITDTSGWTKSIDGKNPRSAAGIKADGSVVYYAVDGRKSSHSNGLSLYQLAYELLSQGCVDVVNLDGGGSTAIAVQGLRDTGAAVKNTPSDGSLRGCSTYILLVNEEASDGRPATLHLSDQNMVVFTNSGASLSYTAKDKGGAAAQTPSDVTASVLSGSGSISGDQYISGTSPGMEKISLSSESTGASGTGTLYVVDSLSSINVYADGGAVSSIKAERDQKIQLSMTADYYGKSVRMDAANVRYTISDGMGTVSGTGLVTISSDPPASGWVKVEAGGVSKTIKINVAGVFSDITGHWAQDYITSLYDMEIVAGSDNGRFYPDSSIKRCDFILMLYRSAMSPSVSSADDFADVYSTDYYYDAVKWARAEGIALGDGRSFNPKSNMTREEAFTFTCRYLKKMSMDQEFTQALDNADTSVLSAFRDQEDMAQFARSSASALVTLKIVGGSDGKINPKGLLTRAEMAKILYSSIDELSFFAD